MPYGRDSFDSQSTGPTLHVYNPNCGCPDCLKQKAANSTHIPTPKPYARASVPYSNLDQMITQRNQMLLGGIILILLGIGALAALLVPGLGGSVDAGMKCATVLCVLFALPLGVLLLRSSHEKSRAIEDMERRARDAADRELQDAFRPR